MRILVVEDEKSLADAISTGLSRHGYSVDTVYDGEEALRILEVNSYDLVVLDLNLPGVDGLEVCRQIRAGGAATGILMLTARSSLDDRVHGLDLGADDYLVKPFHFPELLARIRAILRREIKSRQVLLKCGDLVLDPGSMKVYLKDNEIALTVKEFGIMEYLMRNTGRIVSQEELLEHVWNESTDLFTQTVKVHINNLRRKLESAGGKDIINTVKNRGYFIRDSEDAGTKETQGRSTQ